jgi:hypothetical protein
MRIARHNRHAECAIGSQGAFSARDTGQAKVPTRRLKCRVRGGWSWKPTSTATAANDLLTLRLVSLVDLTPKKGPIWEPLRFR